QDTCYNLYEGHSPGWRARGPSGHGGTLRYDWSPKRLAYWKKTLAFYGLSPVQLNILRSLLISDQNFTCGNCGGNLSGKTCYLDHDHHTGEIRAILCFRCNKFEVSGHTL